MAATPAHKLRVLFVDDEAPIRMMMGLELPRLGYDVTICESGEAAIAALDKHSFDVVVSDLRMPGKSGWDVVEHLEKVAPETERACCQFRCTRLSDSGSGAGTAGT